MKLARFERRWAQVVGAALFPAGTLGGIAGETDFGEGLQAYAGLSPWWTALGLRAALVLVWLSPIVLWGRPRTFGGVEPEAREAALEALLKAELYEVRQLMLFLKMALASAVLGNDRALERLGAYEFSRPEGLVLLEAGRNNLTSNNHGDHAVPRDAGGDARDAGGAA